MEEIEELFPRLADWIQEGILDGNSKQSTGGDEALGACWVAVGVWPTFVVSAAK